MKFTTTVLALAAALFVSACDLEHQSLGLPPNSQLPEVPPRLKQCFERNGVEIPKRNLTVAEVERLWKTDRRTIVIMRECGRDVAAWADSLRANWR